MMEKIRIKFNDTILSIKELIEKVEEDKREGKVVDFYIDGDNQEVVLILDNSIDAWNVNIPCIDDLPTEETETLTYEDVGGFLIEVL